MYIEHKISQIQHEIVTFEYKLNHLGIILKILLFIFGGVYLLRLISPFLFKLLISSILKKYNQTPQNETKKEKKKKTSSDTIGEYIDYEEVD